MLLAAGLVVGLLLGKLRQGAPTVAQQDSTIWLQATAPPEFPFYLTGIHRSLVITPDGTRIVYVTRAGLAIRSLIDGSTAILPGTEASRSPFLSPDGKQVLFLRDDDVMTTPLSGGVVHRIRRIGNGGFRGGALTSRGDFIYATAGSLVLLMTSGEQQTAEPVSTLDVSRGETAHVWPVLLPTERAVLFTVVTGTGADQQYQIAVLNLATRQHTVLTSGAQPVLTPTGHILYINDRRLFAIRFDSEKLTVTGEPIAVLSGVQMQQNGAADFSISTTGTLVYASGHPAPGRALVWVDANGLETRTQAPLQSYFYPRLSPDATRVALDIRGNTRGQISIFDPRRTALNLFTTGGTGGQYPVWSPDGRRIYFARLEGPSRTWLFAQSADGSGVAERLSTDSWPDVQPYSISRDGTKLIVRVGTADLGVVYLQPVPRVEVLLSSDSQELNGELSPNEKFLAYQSDESGRWEVYVRPFPDVQAGRWQITADGGTRPAWSHDAKALYFLDRTGAMMRVSVATDGRFEAATPEKLFEGVSALAGYAFGRNYDVAADGRFLMVKDQLAGPGGRPVELTVVLHWFAAWAGSQTGR